MKSYIVEVPCLIGDRGYLLIGENKLYFTVSRIDILESNIRLRLNMDSGHKRQYIWNDFKTIINFI